MDLDVLQYEELKSIFGCRKLKILCDTLDKEDIPYICDSKGYPLVLRDALNKRMSNGKATPTSPTP